MSPSVALGYAQPGQPSAKSATTTPRTLLLAPPSVSAHPELLERVVEAHDRHATDIQMLDRLAAGLAALPSATYDVILLLTDADGSRSESHRLLKREIVASLVDALKIGGRLKSQDAQFGRLDAAEKTEAVLAGLVDDGEEGMVKPDPGIQAVPLRLGKRTTNGVATANANGSVPLPLNGKRKSISDTPRPVQPPAGVGFVDFSDDLELITGDDDDLVDEDDLLTDADRAAPISIPPECKPKAGKRRRACKDCTCGLKEKIEAEDAQKRAAADANLEKVKFGADDLAEVDFTVQGKVGSCGNCALGDAFRCDGCPYIGLPAFKPGEEVRLLNNDIQL